MELTKDVIFGTLAGLALLIAGSIVIQSWRAPHDVTTLARMAPVAQHAAPEAESGAVVSTTAQAPAAGAEASGDAPVAAAGPADTAAAGAPVADTVENWR